MKIIKALYVDLTSLILFEARKRICHKMFLKVH